MQIKASEQIKSAKSQNRKSRRKFSQIAAKTVLHRSGKINFPEFWNKDVRLLLRYNNYSNFRKVSISTPFPIFKQSKSLDLFS